MDIYVARQPIFSKNMSLYGYELLYRKSENNFYEGEDHSIATADLVHNAFLVMGLNKLTDGTKAFINFTQDWLENEIPRILPKEQVMIEILENVEANKTIITACKKLKDDGFKLALDDFIFHRSDLDYTPLIELADIIKIEYPFTDKAEQQKLLNKYKNQKIFLAEKIETREDYHEAAAMGYELFQGYFFCRPMMVKSKEIGTLNIHLLKILEELQKNDPDFSFISDTIQKDMGLSYKLLKMANSIYFGGRQAIISIRQAVIRLGIHEMKRWVSIMLLREFENPENSELIKVCLLRGKILALIALEFNLASSETDYFLTGLLSSIDIIVNENMETILASLAVSDDVRKALLGQNGRLRDWLDCILKYERFEFDHVRVQLADMDLTLERFMDLYMEALNWLRTTSG